MKNLFDLSGKTALITGGGGLLGPKHAEAIVEYGGKVILADWHEDRAKKKAEQIGDSATYHYMDVTDKKSIDYNGLYTLQTARQEHGNEIETVKKHKEIIREFYNEKSV